MSLDLESFLTAYVTVDDFTRAISGPRQWRSGLPNALGCVIQPAHIQDKV